MMKAVGTFSPANRKAVQASIVKINKALGVVAKATTKINKLLGNSGATRLGIKGFTK